MPVYISHVQNKNWLFFNVDPVNRGLGVNFANVQLSFILERSSTTSSKS